MTESSRISVEIGHHIKKLLALRFVREEDDGYVVDRVMFENMIRIKRSVILVQLGYFLFFATTLSLLLTVFRPGSLTGSYVFALIVNVAALVLFLIQYIQATRKWGFHDSMEGNPFRKS